MTLPVNEIINTSIKFFGQKIFIESSGDKKVDAALKSLFKDDYRHTAPLTITREDAQIVLNWSRAASRPKGIV